MLVPLYTHRNRERDGGVQWIFNDLVIPFQLVEKLGRITQKKYDELNLPSLNPYIGPSVQKKKKKTFINMRRDEQVLKGEASSFSR